MNLAPIALFVYNRPVHTRRTVEALLKNELAAESDLFIFSDAPKKHEAVESVRKVCDYVQTITGFKSVKIVARDRNWGLANSIIDGVTSVVNQYGRVIVLEDDLVVSPHLMEYMNTALDRYQDDERVMQISGHMFPTDFAATTDAVFLPMTTSWGWATWRRAWEHFDPQSTGYAQIKADAALRRRFNLDGAHDYFSMLEAQLAGRVDSWAIRWYLSVFLRNGLVVFPRTSLVENVGFDGSGTHTSGLTAEPVAREFRVVTYPDVAITHTALEQVRSYLCSSRRGNHWIWRVWNRIASRGTGAESVPG
jgi:hypothetical protein